MSARQNKKEEKKTKSKKGFISKIMDKLDRKLEEQAKGASCCNNSNRDKGKPCC